VIYLAFHVSAFWLEIAILGQKFDFFGGRGRSKEWSNVNIKYDNPRKAHSCVIPRILSHYASKLVKGSDLCSCLGKNKKAHVSGISPICPEVPLE